ILAELLSTFRSCLDNNNERVVHLSLNALRTQLPVLLINSYAFTIIGIVSLEDCIQHSANSYLLAKNRSWLDRYMYMIFQFLTDEDSCVHQTAASTFANYVHCTL
ncbi:unnamed protein product, partial [Rotaria sp. Silwood2]